MTCPAGAAHGLPELLVEDPEPGRRGQAASRGGCACEHGCGLVPAGGATGGGDLLPHGAGGAAFTLTLCSSNASDAGHDAGCVNPPKISVALCGKGELGRVSEFAPRVEGVPGWAADITTDSLPARLPAVPRRARHCPCVSWRICPRSRLLQGVHGVCARPRPAPRPGAGDDSGGGTRHAVFDCT